MESDRLFVGSMPAIYDRHLGPWLFQPFAADLVRRVAALAPKRVVEMACGTGIVTRTLAAALPEAAIVATDLNPPMIDHAASRTRAANVTFRVADAQALPFADGEFDVAICEFGVMFFPDKPRAFAEARRVLRPGGRYLFSVWDRLEDNELSAVAAAALAARFPDDPPRFFERVPFGYHDVAAIRRTLEAAGFRDVAPETVTLRGGASARDAAIGICQGNPLANEIEARAPGSLAATTAAMERAIADRFGDGPFETRMQAIVVSAGR